MFNFVTFSFSHFDWSGAEWRNLIPFVGDFSTSLRYARNDKKTNNNEKRQRFCEG